MGIKNEGEILVDLKIYAPKVYEELKETFKQILIEENIIYGNRSISSKTFFNYLERKTGLNIICKTDNRGLRAVRNYQNVSLRLPSFEGF